MKNIIVAVVLVLALFTIGYTAELSSSGEKTADAAIRTTGGGQYGGMVVVTDGTNNCTVKVYDNPSAASGTVLDDGLCVATASYTCKYLFPWPVPYDKGIYVDITTAGTCYYIIYSK